MIRRVWGNFGHTPHRQPRAAERRKRPGGRFVLDCSRGKWRDGRHDGPARSSPGNVAALTLATGKAQSEAAMAQSPINHAPAEPLVWPALAKLPSGIRAFNGHADTVLDIVGKIGAPPSL